MAVDLLLVWSSLGVESKQHYLVGIAKSIGKRRKKWNVAPLCLFWTIWKERSRAKVFFSM